MPKSCFMVGEFDSAASSPLVRAPQFAAWPHLQGMDVARLGLGRH